MGEKQYEAELYRLKGDILLAQKINSQESEDPNPLSQILELQLVTEECFLKALEVSRKQQLKSKSLELRATMSLAQLRQQ
jgi:hypothetical protein